MHPFDSKEHLNSESKTPPVQPPVLPNHVSDSEELPSSRISGEILEVNIQHAQLQLLPNNDTLPHNVANQAMRNPPTSEPNLANRAKKQTELGQNEFCRCRKSHCLKLYCECFSSYRVCGPKCRCEGCENKEEESEIRKKAVGAAKFENSLAFKPKFKKLEREEQKNIHARGCSCKKSGCVKNYCECFRAEVGCSRLCKCTGCQNTKINIDLEDVPKYYEKIHRKRKKPLVEGEEPKEGSSNGVSDKSGSDRSVEKRSSFSFNK